MAGVPKGWAARVKAGQNPPKKKKVEPKSSAKPDTEKE